MELQAIVTEVARRLGIETETDHSDLAAHDKLLAAQAALLAAFSAKRATAAALHNSELRDDAAIAANRARLRATASPLIDAFRAEVQEMFRVARNRNPVSEIVRRGNKSEARVIRSDGPSIARRIAGCVHLLRDEIPALALLAISEPELIERIDGLRSGLPSVEAEDIVVVAGEAVA